MNESRNRTTSGATHEASWEWDPSLYGGAAAHYARGRVAYPPELIDLLVTELGLDGHDRLLDLGCGPGSLTVPLAAHLAEVVAVDADGEMVAEGARQAAVAGVGNISWLHARAEDLPVDLGSFGVATLAQSFHWMSRERVAGLLHTLLSPRGVIAHVHATTHQGVDGASTLDNPRAPWGQIDALVASFLGASRRAGRGQRQIETIGEQERREADAAVFQAAGFTGPTTFEVPARVVDRSTDDVVSSVLSLSYAAPHLFGDRLDEFEQQLREVLRRASPTGEFSEEMREITVHLWQHR